MPTSTGDLPRFKSPPVVETVLGVYFRPPERLTAAHLGLLWGRHFREKFPNLEERVPVEEKREQFGQDRFSTLASVRWVVKDRPDAPRLWAASQDGQHVVQMQRNAFFANWVKTQGAEQYRRYQERRREFSQCLAQVEQFLQAEGLGRIEPTSCLVTYINHIPYGGSEQLGPELARFLACWSSRTSDGWLPGPDNAVLTLAYPMPEQVGRLNVQVGPVVRQGDRQHMLRLDLTARAGVKNAELSEAMALIDLGHEWVVRGFTSLTTHEMHQIWGRIQ